MALNKQLLSEGIIRRSTTPSMVLVDVVVSQSTGNEIHSMVKSPRQERIDLRLKRRKARKYQIDGLVQ
ncbi:hypothetical protein Mapa_015266 [Marchantia paleacea]|nr:hypothetical protein Mapa_015266 [Marchantia paleacea]